MSRTTVSLALVAAIALACATPPPPPAEVPNGLPPDVSAFIARQNRCDVERQEISEGDPRGEELVDEAGSACANREADLAELRAKYPANPEVQDALQFYVDEDAAPARP